MDQGISDLQASIGPDLQQEHQAGTAALQAAMKLHQGHMDGTISRNPDTNAQMTGLLKRAGKAMAKLAPA